MRSYSPEILKRVTDALDEIIPTLPVDPGMPALIAQIGERILETAAEGQASYENLLAVASAEMARCECVLPMKRDRGGSSMITPI